MNADFIMNEEITRLSNEVRDAKARLRDAVRRFTPEPVEDWRLKDSAGKEVRLSALFAGKPDLIVWHNMGRKCVYCTLWADTLRGYADHLQDRAALVLCSPDEPRVLREFSESRGWTYPRVSAHGTEFLEAMRMGTNDDPWPGISALHRRNDGAIVRTGYTYFGPGDDFCPVWPALDLLKDGPNGWSPKYDYRPQVHAVGIDRA